MNCKLMSMEKSAESQSIDTYLFGGRCKMMNGQKIGTHVGRISMQTNRRSAFFHLNTILSHARTHSHNGTKKESNNVELARIFPVFALMWLLLMLLMLSNRMKLTFVDAIHMSCVLNVFDAVFRK